MLNLQNNASCKSGLISGLYITIKLVRTNVLEEVDSKEGASRK